MTGTVLVIEDTKMKDPVSALRRLSLVDERGKLT